MELILFSKMCGSTWKLRRSASQETRSFRGGVVLALAFALAPFCAGGAAAGDASAICDRAASLAAARTGVPISVLKAISLTETGRERGGAMRPWPWTVNMEGKGVWFNTEADALAYAEEHHKRGARSFDVGCFQINYKWHHQNFGSIEEMFDPTANALYAAKYLLELHRERGSWLEAAGAYHSRSPEFADRYKARFAQYRARFLGEDGRPLRVAAASAGSAEVGSGPDLGAPVARVRVNSYPLLQGGGARALGSLMPLSARGAPGGLFDPDDAG